MDLDKIYSEKEINNDYEVWPSALRNLRQYLLYIKNKIAKFKLRDLSIMFLNYLPSEMVEVVGLTMIFSFLIGTILILLFTSDQANTKNLYLKKAK